MNRLLLLFVPFLLGQSVYSQDKVIVRGTFSGAPGHERLYLEPTLEMYPPFREENIIEVTDGQFQFEILAGDTLMYSLLVYSDYLKVLRNQAW
ncbi:MAG: hypothetical protein LUE10_01395, partial [Alistipes sp.]|nr:hypothetical protein [Alistipes sp.]